ncbi:hypothetical protein M422DRAFT_244589 [Sphaerobolus stellatus SS14]|nr:hypothetical protein M422DRAFT_244589 [Sphaerobolus stellatus SS14]
MNSVPQPSKPRAPRITLPIKVYLEKWYDDLGRLPAISQMQKQAALNYIQDNIDPAGLKISQLNAWLTRQRQLQKPQDRQRSSVDIPEKILFRDLTSNERRNLRALLQDDPNPPEDVIKTWTEAPTLPHLTVEIARRFQRHLEAQRHRENSVENERLSQEASSRSNLHLPTPSSASPEPCAPFTEMDVMLSPSVSSSSGFSIPREDIGKLNHLENSVGSKRAFYERIGSLSSSHQHTFHPLKQSAPIPQPPSPISPTQEKARIPRPPSQGLRSPQLVDTSLHRRRTPSPPPDSHQMEGFRNLVELFHTSANGQPVAPQLPPSQRFDLLEKQSNELLQLIENGELKPYGLLPDNELFSPVSTTQRP